MTENDKKKYRGTFYGIRYEDKNDERIKNKILEISEKMHIPASRLIFDYLEKGLNFNEEHEINIDKERLENDFNDFLKNTSEEMKSLENRLKMRNFEKKESFKVYLFKMIPDDIERKKFYLELIRTQFICEKQLLFEFFRLYDIEAKDFVGYFRYLKEKNIFFYNQENCDNFLKILENEFYYRFFYELKIAGVIRSQEDLRKSNINYKALERFIFSIYPGKKMLYSPKEKKEKQLEFISQIKEETRDKISTTKAFSHKFKYIFREFVKSILGLQNEILHYDEKRYQIYNKIGFKPHFIYEILDVDDYIQFIEEFSLRKSVNDCLNQLYLFNKQLNNFHTFPPFEVLINLLFFFQYKEEIDNFLNDLPLKINNNIYSKSSLYHLGLYLYRLTRASEPNKLLLNHELKKHPEIPKKAIQEIVEVIPERYHEVFAFLKADLKKKGIDLDDVIKEIEKNVNCTYLEEQEMYFKSHTIPIQEKLIKIRNNVQKKIKNLK